MGLGYVGLPLAIEFAKSGFNVTGIDLDARKIDAIYKGHSYISDVESDDLKKIVSQGYLNATTDFSILSNTDAVFICVPTPFSKCKEPDVSYIITAAETIRKYMKKKQVIILESTTYPGTTEEVVLPILEKDGKKCGKDFYLVFSPERVDPGNKSFNIKNTPKVIGGIDEMSTKLAQELYSGVIAGHLVKPVSSPKIAEMTKLLENIFRSVNIALINELTFLADRMDIDIWEVIDAASSKPFGFMPFYPGPGVGGHCIPVDPYYLSWKAREYDFYSRFIELSAEINLSMPRHVIAKTTSALNEAGKSVKGAKILALGVAFKKNINDARNSPALKVIEGLTAMGANIDYTDPFIPSIGNGSEFFSVCSGIDKMKSVKLSGKKLGEYDCVVILVDHEEFNIPFITKNAKLIVDTKNVTKGLPSQKGVKIVKI
ncbi:MAG TPA: nucleotide sugar dehydrogenase [bacterium]|nr:nucleotide sugar dehydrogenase [bacterium]